MELEEARDILANCIDDYVISSYCNNTCDEEVDCKNENCIFHQAIEVVLNHLTKQEKMIDKMAKALHLFIWKNDEKIMITSRPKVNCHTLSIEEIKQYFEKKAEESEVNGRRN